MVYLSTTNLIVEQKIPHFIVHSKLLKELALENKLELPNNINIHPVVHVWKLRKHKTDKRVSRQRPNDVTRPPPYVIPATGMVE